MCVFPVNSHTYSELFYIDDIDERKKYSSKRFFSPIDLIEKLIESNSCMFWRFKCHFLSSRNRHLFIQAFFSIGIIEFSILADIGIAWWPNMLIKIGK